MEIHPHGVGGTRLGGGGATGAVTTPAGPARPGKHIGVVKNGESSSAGFAPGKRTYAGGAVQACAPGVAPSRPTEDYRWKPRSTALSPTARVSAQSPRNTRFGASPGGTISLAHERAAPARAPARPAAAAAAAGGFSTTNSDAFRYSGQAPRTTRFQNSTGSNVREPCFAAPCTAAPTSTSRESFGYAGAQPRATRRGNAHKGEASIGNTRSGLGFA